MQVVTRFKLTHSCKSITLIDMKKTTHTLWLDRVTRGDSNRQIAERADVSDATLGRQIKAGELKPDMIIPIAEAYNESPVIALVDLGYVSARWINEPGVVTALSRATDEELTDELLRRLQLLDSAPVTDLASRRGNPEAPDGIPFDAVADSSEEVGGTLDDFDM